jgi:hypothetical protein
VRPVYASAMALPPADPARHRRAQLRRALIGWLGGGAIFVLVVLAVVLGPDEKREEVVTIPAHSAGLLDYHMTSGQYDSLDLGEPEGKVLGELGKIGLPEGATKLEFVRLFPPHDEGVVCSYWQISDAVYTIARLCFSRREEVLRQKLERELTGPFEGESSVRA